MDMNSRKEDHFHLDRTVNISAVIALLILLGTIVSYGNGILSSLHETNNKINIMWDSFVISNPQFKNLYPSSGR